MEAKTPSNILNTSDEQYLIGQSSPTRDAGPCRLSWFLVRNDPLYVPDYGVYRLIHGMDLIDPDYTNAYAGNILSYNIGTATITGRMLAVADNVKLVQRALNDWLKEDRKKYPIFKSNIFVQYRAAANRLVHRILHEEQAVPLSSTENPHVSDMDIFVRDGERLTQAKILSRNSNADELINDLTRVTSNITEKISGSFASINLDVDATTVPKNNPWLLIQFSVSVRDSIYSIVRYNDTIGWEYNAFPGLQTYLLVGKTLFQALIIHKSHSYSAVVAAMDTIMSSCIVSMYPHYDDHEYRNPEIEKYEEAERYTKDCVQSIEIHDDDIINCKEATELIKLEAFTIDQISNQIDAAEKKAKSVLKKLQDINLRKRLETMYT
ncbi:PREDICTED: uncharacterized protein LOC108970071 isoform X1 [Bactrocera latifrons]|uniref:uncharacterized protein LOC108970071 isoform X1 n=1 Tax=Bactrocera latifrons TaxID=174628 RepID=UPI0008DCEC51|nr:PREDICTED: uncharacterized protein LOC108970071 isoform X1 [Bactrocera latifrons]